LAFFHSRGDRGRRKRRGTYPHHGNLTHAEDQLPELDDPRQAKTKAQEHKAGVHMSQAPGIKGQVAEAVAREKARLAGVRRVRTLL
jgi:hypothetical protein